MSDHDGSYKQIFFHPGVIEDLLRGFIHQDWVQHIDFASLEKVNASYVSDKLSKRSDDVVWRVRSWNGDWLYVYLLIELQRKIDPWMALRIMVYVGLLYQDLLKSGVLSKGRGKRRKLPPVFPTVIYNGDKPWRAARELSELIETVPGELAEYLPKQKYWLLDEIALTDSDLPDSPNTVAEMIRMEKSPETGALRDSIARLTEQLKAPENDSLRRALAEWIKQVLFRKFMPDESFPDINDLDEVKTMLANRVEQWKAQWKAEGLQEGIQEGIERGIEQGIEQGIERGIGIGRFRGELAVLERQLTRRFGPLSTEIRQRLHTATLEQVEYWTDRILDAVRIEDVFGSH